MNKKVLTPPCAKCGEKKAISPFSALPAMVGFELENGKIINICRDCLIKVGSMDEVEKDKFFEGLVNDDDK